MTFAAVVLKRYIFCSYWQVLTEQWFAVQYPFLFFGAPGSWFWFLQANQMPAGHAGDGTVD